MTAIRLLSLVSIVVFSGLSFGQVKSADEVLLERTKSLYDQPFRQGLVSFDCGVKFDWKAHFLEILKTIPPTAEPTIDRLQSIQHRVFVDRSGAVVSAVPKMPDLSGVTKAVELEQVFSQMVSGGINAWMPFSTNVILPVGSTKYTFEKLETGYKLVLNGPGVSSTLLLGDDMQITSGVSTQPQPLRFATHFIGGPHGFLLESVKTGETTGGGSEAFFSYTYQEVDGLQLPSRIRIKPQTTELWDYQLTDCKVRKGVVIEIGLPKSN
jgi:hypothetical protein